MGWCLEAPPFAQDSQAVPQRASMSTNGPPLPYTLLLHLLPLSPRSPRAAAPSHICVGAETHSTYCLWPQVQSGPKSLSFNTLRIRTSETITSAQYRNPSLLSSCPRLPLGHVPQEIHPNSTKAYFDTSEPVLSGIVTPPSSQAHWEA